MKLKKIFDYLSLTWTQLAVIAGLVVALEIILSLWTKIEYTSDPTVFIEYVGFPFTAIKVTNTVSTGVYPDLGTLVSIGRVYEYLWGGIIMNLIIYIVFSTVVVKLATRIRDEIEYRRQDMRRLEKTH